MSPALQAARRRHQSAIETHYGEKVVIAAQPYRAAVVLDPVRSEMDEAGVWRKKQTIHVSVRKVLLPTAPARGVLIHYGGAEYKIHGEMGGVDARDVAWNITASRLLPSPS